MGKVSSIRWITKDEDLRQIKGGPISIVTGRNLKKQSTAEGKKAKKKKPQKAAK
jgi:hypothetical protein